jgi:hypothetical protein
MELGSGLVDRGDAKRDVSDAGMLCRHVHEDILSRGRLIAVHDEVNLDALGIRNDDHRGPFGAKGDMESELPVEGEGERLIRYPDADVVDLLNLNHGRRP